MTSTSQSKSAEGETGSEPVVQTPEAATEPRQVPVAAVAAQRQKTRDAHERIAELEAELARLKTPSTQAAPQAAQGEDDIREAIRELRAENRMRGLVTELGLGSQEQAGIVSKLLESNPGLTPAEALDIAARREPEKFKDRGHSGFDPSIHGVLRPTAGSQPAPAQQKSEYAKRFEYSDKLGATRDRNRVRHNVIGHEVAKAIGFTEHKLLKLPE